MLSLPALKEEGKHVNSQKMNSNSERINSGNHPIYDYFSTRISKSSIESLYSNEKDERYLYFLRYGFLRRYEGKGDILYVEIPQIPKNIVIYRKPSYRNKNSEKLYLNKKDLPHIPLLEGEENLKLLSLETNLISKIDHLISLNNLLFLNLYENKISEIENLQTVPKLKALMLGKNNISKIKNLQCLYDIEVLDLHSNKIKLIENLTNLKKLRILNLANNQLTSFVELMNNKNLEDINLRKNLIVSIPNLSLSFEKLRKLNLGKNMISKIEFILEFRKLKRIEELYIEGNPVIFIKDAYKKFINLPLKFKDQAQFELFKNNINLNNNAINNMNSISETPRSNNNYNINGNNQNKGKNLNGGTINSTTSKNNLTSSTQIPSLKKNKTSHEENIKSEISSKSSNGSNTLAKTKSKQSTRNETFNSTDNNNNNNQKNKNNDSIDKGDKDNLTDEERERLLSKIDNEWKIEYKYIVNNGFNGYSIKKLKETKMQLCHAELERERQLNLFGNAIEVLGYKEFYNIVHTIKFEFMNFDIISQRQNVENIKKFIYLRSLIFKSNNMHGFYQIIKLENIKGLEYITIKNNEITNGELLKYFLVYRIQHIRYFNDVEITNKDTLTSKKIFENFDQTISICENESQRKKNCKDVKENGLSLINKNDILKKEIDSNELKYSFFSFVKLNLNTALDELFDL